MNKDGTAPDKSRKQDKTKTKQNGIQKKHTPPTMRAAAVTLMATLVLSMTPSKYRTVPAVHTTLFCDTTTFIIYVIY